MFSIPVQGGVDGPPQIAFPQPRTSQANPLRANRGGIMDFLNLTIGIVFKLATAHATVMPLPSVIPLPQTMQAMPGQPFRLNDAPSVEIPANDVEVRWIEEFFVNLMSRSTKLQLKAVPASVPASIHFLRDKNSAIAREAYAIDISADQGIVVKAASRDGLFYGAVTLYQLITSESDPGRVGVLPALKILDEPSLRWRGFLLDSSRHFQPASFIYQLIDLMALHKLNILHWHLTDDQGWRIEIKHYPKLTSLGGWRIDEETHKRYGGFYTQDEIRQIVAYAINRNIMIVPEFEMPGHASASVISQPEIASIDNPPKETPGDFSILPNLMNPARPATYEFIHNVMDELIELFPGPIHIGGDEAIKDQWKNSPEIQALKKQLRMSDEIALQDWFMAQIGTYVESKGRRAIGYFYPGAKPIRPSMPVEVYLPENPTRQLLQNGYDIVELMYPEMYFDLGMSKMFPRHEGIEGTNTLQNVYEFDPRLGGMTEEEKSHLWGIEGAVWTENIETPESVIYQGFPRALAAAEVGWTSPERREFSDFGRRLAVEYRRTQAFGLRMSDIPYRPLVESTWLSSKKISISVSNQTKFGEFHYTLNGSEPTAQSPIFKSPTAMQKGAKLKMVTFLPSGERLSKTVQHTAGEKPVKPTDSNEWGPE
jgi:hexosaminidase